MRALSVLALALLLLSACDSGGEDNGVARGRFEATLSGDVDTQFSGVASISRPASGETDPLVTVAMVQAGFAGRALTLIGPEAEFTRTGVHTLGSDDGLALIYIDLLGGTETLFSTSGTVRLERADNDRIIGTFDATLRSLDEEQALSVQAVGAFDATPGPSGQF